MNKNNVIALWGAPGTGKTVTAVKIASALAEQKYKVIVLLPDDIAPMIPCICNEGEYSYKGTLGSVFIAPKITTSLLGYQLTTVDKIPNLAFLGYQKGENRYTYPAPSISQCENILSGCSSLADYVIVDICSDFPREILSATSLLTAGCLVRLEAPDIKSVSYLSSNLALLSEHPNYNAEKQLRILNDVYDTSSEIGKQKKNYTLLLPYCKELAVQGQKGNLLSDFKNKPSSYYNKALKKLTNSIQRKVDENE